MHPFRVGSLYYEIVRLASCRRESVLVGLLVGTSIAEPAVGQGLPGLVGHGGCAPGRRTEQLGRLNRAPERDLGVRTSPAPSDAISRATSTRFCSHGGAVLPTGCQYVEIKKSQKSWYVAPLVDTFYPTNGSQTNEIGGSHFHEPP